MQLIPFPVCPECGRSIPTDELWRAGNTNRLGLLIGRIGVVCPHCGVALRVLQHYVLLSSLAGILAPAIALGLILKPTSQDDARLLFVIPAVVIALTWNLRYGHRFAVLKRSQDEGLDYPLTRETQARDVYVAQMEEDERIGQLAATDPSGPPWKCAQCGEENPGEFDICWKCQAASDKRLERALERPDRSARSADASSPSQRSGKPSGE
jgi:hypothetical protein